MSTLSKTRRTKQLDAAATAFDQALFDLGRRINELEEQNAALLTENTSLHMMLRERENIENASIRRIVALFNFYQAQAVEAWDRIREGL